MHQQGGCQCSLHLVAPPLFKRTEVPLRRAPPHSMLAIEYKMHCCCVWTEFLSACALLLTPSCKDGPLRHTVSLAAGGDVSGQVHAAAAESSQSIVKVL